MADVELDVVSPLADCFRHSEVECVLECCGIDAISTDPDLVATWVRQAGLETATIALEQLEEAIVVVEDRSHSVSSRFLNHYTADDAARAELLLFLMAFRTSLRDMVSSTSHI